MAKDRARDDRRSVGSHEKMMGALGKAAGFKRVTMRSDMEGKRAGKTLALGNAQDGYYTSEFEPGAGHVRVGHKVESPEGPEHGYEFKEK